jgi:hypothetical protein
VNARSLRFAALFSLVLAACETHGPTPPSPPPLLTSRFVSDELGGCLYASPVLGKHGGADVVVVESSAGEVAALDPATGHEVFSVSIPVAAGQGANVAATPALVGNELLVTWQDQQTDSQTRVSHHVAMIDLDAGAFDPAFADTTLAGSRSGIDFLPAFQFSRSAIAVARPADKALGYAYVSFANLRDIEPWHGWVFELDLDAWRSGATAITGMLLTTASTSCGNAGDSGTYDTKCGGGVWAPAGPKVVPTASGYDLIVPTGNGFLDPTAGAYANTLMRTGRGLAFDPGCDMQACAGWSASSPPAGCEESCKNLFIPRRRASDPVPGGACDGKSFFDCYAEMDWDLGADSPAHVSIPGGPDVLVMPAKDGGVYLVDATNLGTMYDRRQIAAVCGSDGATCLHGWTGMMVTEPAVTAIGGTPVVLVPTFEFDALHPAGLVALAIVMTNGQPAFQPLWTAPDASSSEAVKHFRESEGRVALGTSGGVPLAFLVDVDRTTNHGTLYVVRIADGAIVQRQTLAGPGMRFSQPLIADGAVYVTSCKSDSGPGHVEAFTLAP